MTNSMQIFEKEQIDRLISKKRIPAFRPGDTLRVTIKIVEGDRSRLQAFEGMCIARKNNSVNSKFTVRKMSHGEGVERVFPLFSPIIDKIEVIRKGDVKRAKLYYLRDRTGKSARIADRDRGEELDQYDSSESEEGVVEDNKIIEVDNDENQEIVKEEIKAESTSAEEKSSETVEEPIVEDKKSVEEKSESTAPKAGNTEDVSKS